MTASPRRRGHVARRPPRPRSSRNSKPAGRHRRSRARGDAFPPVPRLPTRRRRPVPIRAHRETRDRRRTVPHHTARARPSVRTCIMHLLQLLTRSQRRRRRRAPAPALPWFMHRIRQLIPPRATGRDHARRRPHRRRKRGARAPGRAHRTPACRPAAPAPAAHSNAAIIPRIYGPPRTRRARARSRSKEIRFPSLPSSSDSSSSFIRLNRDPDQLFPRAHLFTTTTDSHDWAHTRAAFSNDFLRWRYETTMTGSGWHPSFSIPSPPTPRHAVSRSISRPFSL